MRIKGAEYLTISEFCEKYPDFNIDRMRALLRKRHENGLNEAIYRLGSKTLFIREDTFFKWFESRKGQ